MRGLQPSSPKRIGASVSMSQYAFGVHACLRLALGLQHTCDSPAPVPHAWDSSLMLSVIMLTCRKLSCLPVPSSQFSRRGIRVLSEIEVLPLSPRFVYGHRGWIFEGGTSDQVLPRRGRFLVTFLLCCWIPELNLLRYDLHAEGPATAPMLKPHPLRRNEA